MRDTSLESLSCIAEPLRIFKKKFPDAVWSVGEPPVEAWRRGKKAKLNADGSIRVPATNPAPFTLFIATDDKIGEASHVFRLVDGDDLWRMLDEACESIRAEVEAKKSSKPIDTNRAVR